MLNALEVVLRHDLKGFLGRCDFLDRKSGGDGQVLKAVALRNPGFAATSGCGGVVGGSKLIHSKLQITLM
ncbi:hypothetical protein BBJ66_28960 [Rhizobium sp. RSm-3]|nr:hypothetical protein RCCGEPOP_32106 [Rhizobium sp. Pop5]OHV22827.1 hypothetical protein BBJ66_28960 [Rhizobium sp. RSm-3]PON01996.1 hypothetical protein ATY29_33455 [Rhizobium hidalgonense]